MTTLVSCVFGMSNLVLMFIYSWQLALAVTLLLILTFFFVWAIARSQMKTMLKMQNVIGKQAGLELQMVTGITKLRTAGAEANIFSQWMEYFTAVRKISLGIGHGYRCGYGVQHLAAFDFGYHSLFSVQLNRSYGKPFPAVPLF